MAVRGMEDLPEAVFLQGGDPLTDEALQANLPDLSRPEVQAYIVRCAAKTFSTAESNQNNVVDRTGQDISSVSWKMQYNTVNST